MSKQTRLKTILDYITNQEETAARELAIWLQKQRETQLQIINLQQYHSEYASENSGAGVLAISKLKNRQHFLAKLCDAIQQQKTLLSEFEKEINTHSQTWQQAKSKREGLENIMRGYQKQARVKEERQLQTDLDTYSARGSH